MARSFGRTSLLSSHGFSLVSIALLLNLLLDKKLGANNYTLTAFLVFGYVVQTVVSLDDKIGSNVLSSLITSLLLAVSCNYLLSLDRLPCLVAWSFASMVGYFNICSNASPQLRSSFSLAELLIVSQLSMAYLSTGTACLISHLLRASTTSLFCSPRTPDLVIQVIFVGIAAIVASQTLVAKRTSVRKRALDLAAVVVPIVMTFYFLLLVLPTDPIVWLIGFLLSDANRTSLVLEWISILVVTTLVAVALARTTSPRASTIIRKLFHVSLVMVYMTGIKRDIVLLSFCSASLLAVFVVLEVLRVTRMPPLGPHIEQIWAKFRDEKDSGFFTLSHIYLLVGTSLPIWLNSSHSADHSLAITSGVITVGIGDAAAAVGGSLFGRHRWPASKKTYEGTLCAFVAQVCATLLILDYLVPMLVLTAKDIAVMALISMITALIEAQLTDIDNLILPIYHYILVKSLFQVI